MTSIRRATPEEIADVGRVHQTKDEIDWSPYADGDWWLIHEGEVDESPGDRARAYERIKKTAGRWAARHGYQRKTRRRECGRRVWVRFTKREAS